MKCCMQMSCVLQLLLAPAVLAAQEAPQSPPLAVMQQPAQSDSGSAFPVVQDKQQKKEAPPDFVQYDQAPQVINQVQPKYPREAVKNKTEGTVWTNLWVDESGKVLNVKIMKSEAEVLNQAAIDAAKQWTFKPAVVKEKPVAVWVTVPFRFSLVQEKKKEEDQKMRQPQEKVPPAGDSQYDQAPEVIKQVQPKYPAEAKKENIQGGVWLNVWIDEAGDIKEVKVQKSDAEVFNKAAMEAARQWKFKPAISKGKPVAVWITIPFKFALK